MGGIPATSSIFVGRLRLRADVENFARGVRSVPGGSPEAAPRVGAAGGKALQYLRK